MIATESELIIFYSDKTIEIRHADDIAECKKKSTKMVDLGAAKGDAVAISLVSSKNEIWVADNKGMVNILSSETLEPLADTPELKTKYGHAAVCMTTSHDGGSLVAVGDTKGYVTVFDAETRAEKCYYALHNSRVLKIKFTADNLWLVNLG